MLPGKWNSNSHGARPVFSNCLNDSVNSDQLSIRTLSLCRSSLEPPFPHRYCGLQCALRCMPLRSDKWLRKVQPPIENPLVGTQRHTEKLFDRWLCLPTNSCSFRRMAALVGKGPCVRYVAVVFGNMAAFLAKW